MKYKTGTPSHAHTKNISIDNKLLRHEYLKGQQEKTKQLLTKVDKLNKNHASPEKIKEIAALIHAGDIRKAKAMCSKALLDKIIGEIYLGKL